MAQKHGRDLKLTDRRPHQSSALAVKRGPSHPHADLSLVAHVARRMKHYVEYIIVP